MGTASTTPADKRPLLPAQPPSSKLVQSLAVAVSTHRLYPPEHPFCIRSLERVILDLEPLFTDAGSLTLAVDGDSLRVNASPASHPVDLVRWLSTLLRGRLITEIYLTSDLEPNELVAFFGLIASTIKRPSPEELRKRLHSLAGDHLRLTELEYRLQPSPTESDASLAEQDWLLAIYHAADAALEPAETDALVSRLQELASSESPEPLEEVNLLRLIASAASHAFGEHLADQGFRVEQLLGYLLRSLDSKLDPGLLLSAGFRRRQVFGVVAQRVLSESPDLIQSIAMSAGPLLPQIQARAQSVPPGEALMHLFMRSPSPDTSQRPDAPPPSSPSPRPEDKPFDPDRLLEGLKALILSDVANRYALPSCLDPDEITREYSRFLAGQAASGQSSPFHEAALGQLRTLFANELAFPGSPAAVQVIALLAEGQHARLPLSFRQSLFSTANPRHLLRYVEREIPSRDGRIRALRVAKEMLGEPFLEEAVKYVVDLGDTPQAAKWHPLLAETFGPDLTGVLARLSQHPARGLVPIALHLADRLELSERLDLLTPLLNHLGPTAPLDLPVRLARIPTPFALKPLNAWLPRVPLETRRTFADRILSLPNAGDLHVTAEIAAGKTFWRTMFPQRAAALAALSRSSLERSRELLHALSRKGRFSLSRAKRDLARSARTLLATPPPEHRP
ncbi:MAG: hypothetical protein V2A58_00140 [Planctomycetota bacterium]